VKRLCLLIILSPLLLSCGKSLDKQVHDQVRTLDGAFLDEEAVEVLEVREQGSTAIAEINVKTAVKMRKKDGNWTLEEVRLGDRRWESIDRILAAIEESRTRQTEQQLGQIRDGIRKYRDSQGEVPQAESFEVLIDVLNPHYLDSVIRLDGWANPFSYLAASSSTYELRSAGPDREFFTDDDLVSP
jgi:hypothetical protein